MRRPPEAVAIADQRPAQKAFESADLHFGMVRGRGHRKFWSEIPPLSPRPHQDARCAIVSCVAALSGALRSWWSPSRVRVMNVVVAADAMPRLCDCCSGPVMTGPKSQQDGLRSLCDDCTSFPVIGQGAAQSVGGTLLGKRGRTFIGVGERSTVAATKMSKRAFLSAHPLGTGASGSSSRTTSGDAATKSGGITAAIAAGASGKTVELAAGALGGAAAGHADGASHNMVEVAAATSGGDATAHMLPASGNRGDPGAVVLGAAAAGHVRDMSGDAPVAKVTTMGGAAAAHAVGASGNTDEHNAAFLGTTVHGRAGDLLGDALVAAVPTVGSGAGAHDVGALVNAVHQAAAMSGGDAAAHAVGASGDMGEREAAFLGAPVSGHASDLSKHAPVEGVPKAGDAVAAPAVDSSANAPMRGSPFASRAGAAIALSRRAARGGRLFPPPERSSMVPSSPSRRPAANVPLPRRPSQDLVAEARSRQSGRPDAAAGIFPATLHRPDEPLAPTSKERDVFDETINPVEFRSFSPHQVGAAIATFAGAQLSHVRQLELFRAFTLGAVEGNVVGLVAVQEDIHRVAEAVVTFYRRAHDGRVPYGTECRVLRFLRRMR